MGKFLYRTSILGALLILSLQYQVFGQNNCRDLPSNSDLEELMAVTYTTSDNPTAPSITIQELNYVCLVSGEFRDTFRTFSVVARYECVGVQCDSMTQSQYEFTCRNNEWIGTVSGTLEFSRTTPSDAALTTSNRTDCAFCISPSHPNLPDTILDRYDPVRHCIACDAACNQGDMRCFGLGDDDCCNFYNQTDDRCLNECPENTRPNDNFVCTAMVGFSQSVYVFSEEQGTGSIQINGSAGFEVRVVGGPNFNMANVVISGTDIDRTVISPATVTFNITNDDVAVEDDETYLVTLIPSNPSVFVERRMAQIVILDDVDRIQMGFEKENNIRVEGNMTDVNIRISGSSVQDFIFFYQQEGRPASMLTAMAGMYTDVDFIRAPIVNPDDEIALQPNRVFNLSLEIASEFVDDVELGAMVGPDETFSASNLTVLDDDIVTVSFTEPAYTVQESGNVLVTLSLDKGIASDFYIEVLSVSTMPVPGLVPSILNNTYRLNFTINDQLQNQSFTFIPNDDDIPNEPDERGLLIIYRVSNGEVLEGDSADLIVIDDDTVGEIGFSVPSYTFFENEMIATVIVQGPAIFPAPLSVRIMGGPGRQPGAVLTSGTDVDMVITSFPATITFPLIDDEGALEPVETYQLTLIPSDPSIIINQPTANISILDEDVILVGFPYEEMTFPASAIGNATLKVFGQAQQGFTVNYTQEATGVTTSLQLQAGNYTADFVMLLPIDRPSDPLIRMFQLILSRISDGVIVGGIIDVPGSPVDIEVFPIANIILEDDDIIVGFRDPDYTFSEGGPDVATVFVAKSGDSSSPFTVDVSKASLLGLAPFIVTSAVASNLAGTVEFGAGPMAPAVEPYALDLSDDDVALENNEQFTLRLSDPSISSVTIGGNISGVIFYQTARITILDNDIVTLGIDGSASRTLIEGESTDVCVSTDIGTIRTVNFDLIPQDGTAGGDDYTPNVTQSGSLPPSLSGSSLCFRFMAISDGVMDSGESFNVVLESTDSFPTGPGGLQIGNDEVEITINEPAPPDDDVEDTVIGDPLFTVPIPESQHLCYEIRGTAGQYFNFISDACVSVNAHYTEQTLAGEIRQLHVIHEITIRAVDNAENCVNILVDRNGCTASVNSASNPAYSSNGVMVNRVGNRVTVNVPNCNDTDLAMEIICETMNGIDMLRFEVMRGLNLRETSHGLLAQFWNVDVSISEFAGVTRGTGALDNLVLVTLTPSQSPPRTFPAWQETKTWDNRKTCLYAGNQNGGTVYEVVDDHDTLIEGVYTDYLVASAFSTEFKFSQFDEKLC